MKKYYTPELEEFHEGFEYEKLILGTRWNEEIWDAISSFDYSELYDFDVKDCRVKYLDREDIESLGFELYISKSDYTIYKGKGKCSLFKNVYLDLEEGMTVEIHNNEDFEDHATAFYGTIKNKSELKRVLKMITYE